MPLTKKKLALVSIIFFLAFAALLFFYLSHFFLKNNTEKLLIKDISNKEISVDPGISIDNTEPNQGRFWITGIIKKIDSFTEVLPANQNSQNEDIEYGLLQITLSVPTDNSNQFLDIKAVTEKALPLTTTTDNLNFESISTPEVEKNLHVGQLVRINVLNQSSEVFQSKWTQKKGGWNPHGQMMLYLLNNSRDDVQKILNSRTSNSSDITVVFDGIQYNKMGMK